MSSPIPRLLKTAALGLVAGGLLYFGVRAYFPRASELDWDKTSAAYPSPAAPQALVHGWTKTPLGAWRYSFLWKIGPDKWDVYELSQTGTQWDRFDLRKEGNNIYVLGNGEVIGMYDPVRGEFDHVRDKKVDKTPPAAIHAANLDHETKWTYWANATAAP